jgi:prepilin-type processing-associated H-X9-DG protein
MQYTIRQAITVPNLGRPSAAARGTRPPRTALGFTRLELAIVMVVLALLFTTLLSGLTRFGTQSRTFQCLNNLHQLTLAWREYTEDNQDKLLYASSSTTAPPPISSLPVWVNGAMDYDGANRSNWDPAYNIFRSPMWPYCTNAYEIWRCPSDPSYVIFNGVARPRVRSISMNVYLGGFEGTDGGWGWSSQFRLFLKATDLTAPGPAKTFVFPEMRPDSINWPDFQTEMSGYPNQPALYQFNTDYPNMLHDLACNFSFADGHAETHRWLDPRTVPAFVPQQQLPIGPIIAAPGDPDIAWLQDHATRPK